MACCIRCTTLLFSAICLSVAGNDAARILGIFPTASKSHWILGTALAKELAKVGHEVTVISPFKLQNPLVNYREIEIQYSGRAFDDAMNHVFESTENSVVSNLFQMWQYVEETTNATLTSPAVQRLLQSSNETFDLLLLEIFLDDALLGFGDRFQCPIVGMSTFGAITFVNDLTGTPQPLSYVPHQMLSYTSNMTFWQRLVNVAFHGVEAIVMRYIYLPIMQQYYAKFFPNASRSLEEMRRHGVSVVLVNSHFSMSFLRPYTPNMIEVGGFHVNRKVNSLPQDIKIFIENSEHGVIYFSLGGNVKPSKMDPRKRDAMIRALSRAQQNIIWKWDDETLQLDERKFLVRRWLPQDDILAHPKVRLFITHGGLLSCTEAIYHGVPIVAIPIFGDQPFNAARVAQAGWGVTVAYSALDEYSFERAVNEVLQEERYRLKVKQISRRYRDQPLTPMQTAMFWIEYVLRHGKSAEHLRSPAQELSSFEYYNLDVYALLTVVSFTAVYHFVSTLKWLLMFPKLCAAERGKKGKISKWKLKQIRFKMHRKEENFFTFITTSYTFVLFFRQILFHFVIFLFDSV